MLHGFQPSLLFHVGDYLQKHNIVSVMSVDRRSFEIARSARIFEACFVSFIHPLENRDQSFGISASKKIPSSVAVYQVSQGIWTITSCRFDEETIDSPLRCLVQFPAPRICRRVILPHHHLEPIRGMSDGPINATVKWHMVYGRVLVNEW